MRQLRPVFVALVIILLLAGCSSKVPQRKVSQDAPSATEAPAITSVRVLGHSADPLMDAIISAFYKKYSNIRVEKVPYAPPGTQTIQTTQILLEKLRNNDIDLFPVSADAPMLVKENLVLNLDPFIKKSGMSLAPYESAMGALRSEGKVYGIPLVVFPQAILYNVDMFTARGVPLPKAGWSWDEFRGAALKLTQGSGESKIWGMANDFGPEGMAYSMLYERKSGPSIDPQGAKEMLQYWSTLINLDKTITPAPKRDASGVPAIVNNPLQPFENGTAAMTLVSLNGYQWQIQNIKFKFDLAPMPVTPGRQATLSVYPRGYGIAAGSPNAEAAWKFLEFMASEEGAVALARSGQLPILRTEPVKQAWFERNPPPPQSTESYFSAEMVAQTLPTDEKNGKISSAFSRALQGVLQGGADWEVLYTEFLAEREKILSEP